VHLGSFVTRAKRFEAPEFVEVVVNEERTLLLPGGLPYHTRVGPRMLDTLLITAGETCRKFRFGIGVDVPHPWMAALEMAAPQTVHDEVAAPPAPASYGWLFHLDMKNVTATHWGSLVELAEVVGFRCRLLETEGRLGRLRLRCFRSPKSAERTEFNGQSRGTLPIEDDCVLIDYNGHEWVQVEARWK
jgi:alpha-mannosidase